ncbi:VWD domain-containing protein [Spirosoma soli]|uniref:VWD domain-containing protein n=1 Tax=Spirosoma soli TaxID=1770529 RepID=A0ABW5MDE5_9BACT
MSSVLRFFALFLLCLLPFSCKKDSEPDVKPELPRLGDIKPAQIIPTKGAPTLRTTVYVIDEETAANIVSISPNRIVFKAGTQLRGGRQAARLAVTTIQPGNIMIGGVTAETPNGYMAKATRVNQTSNGVEVDTEPASWTDVFDDIEFSFDESLGESMTYSQTFNFASANGGAQGQVTGWAKGGINFVFSFGLNIKQASLKDALAKVTITRTASAGASASAEVSGSDEFPFLKKKFVITRVVFVGPLPIPIVITPTLTLKLRAAAGLKGKVEATLVNWQDSYEYGLAYNNIQGFTKIQKDDSPQNNPSFQAEMEGYIESGVVSELSIGFYNSEAFVFGGSLYLFGRLTAVCSTEKKGLSLTPSYGLTTELFAGMDIFGVKERKPISWILSKSLDERIIPGVKLCEPDSNEVDSTSTSTSTGDPHLTTFDRNRYSFMAAGEFTATQSTNDNFEVQVRQEPVNNSKTVSVNTGLAVRTGQNIVCFYPPNRLYVDRQPVPDGTSLLPLSSNGTISRQTPGNYFIRTATGDKIEIRAFATSFDYYITPSSSRRSKLRGLLGNYDRNPANDLTKANGQSIGNSFKAFYPEYADSWRITQTESMFLYDTGKNTDSYTVRDFPLFEVQITQQARADAERICRQSGVTDPIVLEYCITDVASTGNAEFAQRALRMQEVNRSVDKFSIDDFGLFRLALLISNGASTTTDGIDLLQLSGSNQASVFWKANSFDITNGYETAFTVLSTSLSPEVNVVFNRDVNNVFSQISSVKLYNKLIYYGNTTYSLPIELFDGKPHRVRLITKRTRSQNSNSSRVEMIVDDKSVLNFDYPDGSSEERVVAYPGLTGSGGTNKKVTITGWSFQPL